MPYRLLVCNDCDRSVPDGGPHGPEDEYCEGESGYERIEAFTPHEIERRLLSTEALDAAIRVYEAREPTTGIRDIVQAAAEACHLLPPARFDASRGRS